ncbi:GNAT family N-acetyltransferase [Sedimentitalea todarodis]|uniref:GNAT family N-acetyltransferase n=1 Tax=Sedimentitalea todarodis TaxID=1631240 RepID=A0ABU3VDY1_9RHOB|nr:GNAT family N-acetyltransferase [Sedimentitalea todarodis]MDU9004385.1 GNAT family N-acetyltransferase [Sedimentitalea todarodis]
MLEIRRIDPLSDDGTNLFQRLSQEQIDRYGRDGGRKLVDLAREDVLFMAAYLDGVPVACGAVVPFDKSVGELSRIFVDPSARKNGVGTAVMGALEEAIHGRYSRLVLETGTEQPESMHLYEKCGYTPITCWGESANNSKSRCYEKQLSAGPKGTPDA